MSWTDRAATSRIRPGTRGALAAVVAAAVAGATLTAVSPAFGDPVTGMTGHARQATAMPMAAVMKIGEKR